MNALRFLVYSDLDGTLLDHFSYQFSAATPALKALDNANIPVILNTSKTFAEVTLIHQALNLSTPFIIENGAAIYIPVSTFNKQPKDTKRVGQYWVKSFCLPRKHWLDLLSEYAAEFSSSYQGFSTLSDTALASITGLTEHEAKLARQRQYGEPIQWLADDSSKQQFIERLLSLGVNVVQGGRFMHICGHCDKGQALTWLTNEYCKQNNKPSLYTVALGDGENDSPMLEAADIAVQIRSPIHDFPNLQRQFNTMQTTDYGPKGWSEAVQQLLANQLSTPTTTPEVNHG